MSAVLDLPRAAPATTRNGLTVRFYRYQGTNGPDLLTPEIDAMPDHLFGDGPSEGRRLAPCGTEAAYARHRRRGEPIDELCREADTRASYARRAARERTA